MLGEGGVVDYMRRDAVVEAIVQFITCASLTADYLAVYHMEWQLRRSNDARTIAKETLTQMAKKSARSRRVAMRRAVRNASTKGKG